MSTSKPSAPLLDHTELGPDPIAERLAGAFTSERLRYRGVEQSDADLLYRLRSDPAVELNANGGWPRPYTHALAADFAKILQGNILSVIIELDPAKDHGGGMAESLRHPDGDSAATRTATSVSLKGVAIGNVSLRACFDPATAPVRMAELAVNMLPAYQGKGYAAEAMRWLLDWAFDLAGLHRVRLATFSYNTRAIRAYEAVGFKRCGVEPEALWIAGRWWDFVSYELLDREWAEIKEQRRKRGLRM